MSLVDLPQQRQTLIEQRGTIGDALLEIVDRGAVLGDQRPRLSNDREVLGFVFHPLQFALIGVRQVFVKPQCNLEAFGGDAPAAVRHLLVSTRSGRRGRFFPGQGCV